MTIFITVKGTSIRCPNKNKILLPYTLNKIKDLYINIIVITDSMEIQAICNDYNVNCYIENKSKQLDEFNSIYSYLVDTNELENIKEFILLPVTQPLCNIETINNVINAELDEYDLITTYTYISNRSIFLLNDDNSYMYDSYERKGSLCKQTKMIDGCIYKLSTEFLIKVIKSNESNHIFWNESKIKFIENTSDFFLDIDEKKDFYIFEKYIK